MAYFDSINSKQNFPQLEKEILKYWLENNIEKKHLVRNQGEKQYIFYDGPPTANGKPHIGHVITRAFKDVFPRYKTMRGFYVERKAGWDTHGLPVEVSVEKELGINSKEEIENLVPGDKVASIKKFNGLCKENVWKYIDLWEKMSSRVGHFIDLSDPYVTYKREYIESVWWSLKELFNRNLLYPGYKVVPYCIRCGTPLSSHELAQDYQKVIDTSVYVRFPLKNAKKTSLIVWTTTPWTLPGHVALAVNPKIDYVFINDQDETLILAKDVIKKLGFSEDAILKKLKGKDLLGLSYTPPFTYLADKFKENENLHTVLDADFVTTEDGSGIVHTAVMYGQEDFELGKEKGLPMYHLVNERGEFTKEVGDFSGMDVQTANPKIIDYLKNKDLLWKAEDISHQYPFCWRCHNPLIYYALESWFIKTTLFKNELLKNNQQVNWIPEYVGKGRMKNWYETLVDWSLSRNRYWGTPLPIWRCNKCDHMLAIGSLEELKNMAVTKHKWSDFDLHRPWVDEVEIACNQCHAKMKRVPEVIDAWYDSGSMPFAQLHYPSSNQEKFSILFPADFISEAIDQTRGWFFSLQAISTMLFGKTPYKNAVVFQHALDPKGKKMSKHLGNVLDPWEAFSSHGADATRWFFFSSVSIGTQYRVSLETIGKSMRSFILPLWNSYNFFVTYANLDNWKPQNYDPKPQNGLEKWILSRLNQSIGEVTEAMDNYDTFKATNILIDFINDYSNWYVRRSRERLGIWVNDSTDKQSFYATAYFVLTNLCKLMAPIIPFVSEEIYRNLTKEQSVHLTDWPQAGPVDHKLLDDMAYARLITEKAHALRKEQAVAVRQPLAKLTVISPEEKLDEAILEIIKGELNVKAIVWEKGSELKLAFDTKITPVLKEEAKTRELIRKIQVERRNMSVDLAEKVSVKNPWLPEDPKLIDRVMLKTGATSLTKGVFEVKKV